MQPKLLCFESRKTRVNGSPKRGRLLLPVTNGRGCRRTAITWAGNVTSLAFLSPEAPYFPRGAQGKWTL